MGAGREVDYDRFRRFTFGAAAAILVAEVVLVAVVVPAVRTHVLAFGLGVLVGGSLLTVDGRRRAGRVLRRITGRVAGGDRCPNPHCRRGLIVGYRELPCLVCDAGRARQRRLEQRHRCS